MIHIKTLKDLELLKKSSSSKNLLEYMTKYFQSLHKNLGEDIPLHNFDLEEHGWIVVIESSDDENDLTEIGLDEDNGGLITATFEYVNVITLPDGSEYYNMLVLANNEFGYPIFIAKSACSKELNDCLMEYVVS